MNRKRIDALRIDGDPVIRLAIEALDKIASADYRGNRPIEQTQAYRALEEISQTGERIDEARRLFDERVRAAWAESHRPAAWVDAWQFGSEHVTQEGSDLGKLRQEYGLTREEVEALSGGMLAVPMQELLEDYPGLPDVEQLEAYAAIFSRPYPDRPAPWVATERKPTPPKRWSPGGLLNYLLERAGEPLMAELDADERREREAHIAETT